MKLTKILFGIMFILSMNDIKAQTSSAVMIKDSLPSIPISMVKLLWDSCSLIDYTFYELPVSMSMPDQKSIRQALRHIGSLSPGLKSDCKPIGKIFYQINGNIVLDADFYFKEQCVYFIFNKDGKKMYSNMLSNEGIVFFKKAFASIKTKENKQ